MSLSPVSANAPWQPVIGLEVHVQLSTASKLFSRSATAYGAEANSQANVVDLAFPGVLPVPNRRAIEMALAFGLAINAQIARVSQFARKNYFYPDLPKGYQISQFEQPIVGAGSLRVRMEDATELSVPIVRAHLEEDAGKSLHDAFHGSTALDLNRAGVPLIEVVTAPALRSSTEAVAYLRTLHTLVRFLGICDGNMQEGSFRCDANVSVHKPGTPLGTRAEIKNVNSFRFVEKAIDYEIERQIRLLEGGGTVIQETRLYDAARDETRSMRSKENSDDYRYFPDPDLPPIVVTDADLERIRASLPELPEPRRQRYESQLGLSQQDAAMLAGDKAASDYFESALKLAPEQAKPIANWMQGEIKAALNAQELDWSTCRLPAASLVALLARIADGSLSNKQARTAFEALWAGDYAHVEAAIAGLGLQQINDTSALSAIIDAVIAQFPEQVSGYQAGNDKLLMFLVGQAMKASKGQGNPQQLNQLLQQRLG